VSMYRSSADLTYRIAHMLRQALEQGATVEIDGLGKFVPGGKRGYRFVGQTKPRVFIAYVEEDLSLVKKLYQAFEQHGFRPWLDKKNCFRGRIGRGPSKPRFKHLIFSWRAFRAAPLPSAGVFTASCATR